MADSPVRHDVEVVDGPLGTGPNALGGAASAYLRSAKHQPVAWMEWGEEAFARAAREDKPVLLDIGAVWCHWCHVMDRESYEDTQTAALINEHYVAVKVDRDERPDVDSRYQAAVSAISGQGGWPLTAFLTPTGKPFFGGTYFPPDDRHGRPSLRRVLLTMAEAFHTRRDEVEESATAAIAAIEQNETFSGPPANAGPDLLGKLLRSALQQFDPKHGGFGAQPKFPHSGAIDLLLDASMREASLGELAGQAKAVALTTLDCMARGGICDQLAGGFHRYSTDERWVVPHFEKMLYDNTELLKNYVHAFQSYRDPEHARVAREIVRWMDECLSDRELGGFFASQDADVSLDDDGDYFTWTLDEAAAVLPPEELRVAAAYFDIGPLGDMRHDPGRNVLHVTRSLDAIAAMLGIEGQEAQRLLAAGREKLSALRKLRPTPFIDRTIYTGWNGMAVSAYLAAGRVMDIPDATAFALKTLDRVLQAAWSVDSGMARVVAYSDGAASPVRVAGVLEDYVFTGHAALDAWEATGDGRYFETAEAIAHAALDRFHDSAGGAFFDTEVTPGSRPLGALAARRKPLQDAPTPAGNPVAAALLSRLAALTAREDYAAKAQETLEHFAGVVEHFGLFAATYGLALRRHLHGPLQVCIVGEDMLAESLERAANAPFLVNKNVIRLRRNELTALPAALAGTLQFVPEQDGSYALLCFGSRCLPSVRSPEELVRQISAAAT